MSTKYLISCKAIYLTKSKDPEFKISKSDSSSRLFILMTLNNDFHVAIPFDL